MAGPRLDPSAGFPTEPPTLALTKGEASAGPSARCTVGPAAAEQAEIRLLTAALDAEGSGQRSQGIPAGLADRIFDASVIELRAGLVAARTVGMGLEASDQALKPALRLVDTAYGTPTAGRPGRALMWRRLAPLAAMAACIALAPLVAIPSIGPAWVTGPGNDAAQANLPSAIPVAFMDAGTPVEPVLAALLQKDTEGAWAGVPMMTIDASMLHPISPKGCAAEHSGVAPMIPIVEAHQSEFSDFAAEFARIREAATRKSNRS